MLGGNKAEKKAKKRENGNVLISKVSCGLFTTPLVSLKMLFVSGCLNS